uniref:Uncharacterized protein n=1 Tax=Guillardia theta TaxID=55529 RepID=A0A7S4KKC7_GUITH|mmetsp:Transcript_26261/g.86323  ORF Transcript_26261/g.86323 Transcript_26261/m.86323 type:complete len:255 (+) Transcript_26261:125-889(+)
MSGLASDVEAEGPQARRRERGQANADVQKMYKKGLHAFLLGVLQYFKSGHGPAWDWSVIASKFKSSCDDPNAAPSPAALQRVWIYFSFRPEGGDGFRLADERDVSMDILPNPTELNSKIENIVDDDIRRALGQLANGGFCWEQNEIHGDGNLPKGPSKRRSDEVSLTSPISIYFEDGPRSNKKAFNSDVKANLSARESSYVSQDGDESSSSSSSVIPSTPSTPKLSINQSIALTPKSASALISSMDKIPPQTLC